MGLKIVTVSIFLAEAFLSHQGGKESGMESRWLSEWIGIKEGILRSYAHALLFAVLTVFSIAAFGTIGLIATAVWAVVDEMTKPLLHNERHCSGKDILLNLIGEGIGAGLAALVSGIC